MEKNAIFCRKWKSDFLVLAFWHKWIFASGLLVLAFWLKWPSGIGLLVFFKKIFVKIICKNRIIQWQSHNNILFLHIYFLQVILIINNMYTIMLLLYYWYWDKIKALYILTSSDMCGCARLTSSVKVLRTSSHPSLIIPSDNMRVTIFLYLSMVLVYLIQSFHWQLAYRTENDFIQLQAILHTIDHMTASSDYDNNVISLYIYISFKMRLIHEKNIKIRSPRRD